MNKPKLNFLPLLTTAMLLVLAFALGWQSAQQQQVINPPALEAAAVDASNFDIDLFRQTLRTIQHNYVEPNKLTADDVKYGALRGLVWALKDPYSALMTPQESTEFSDELSGDLQGIGAEMTVRHELIVVVSPLKDSPAERAGLLPGDTVLKVDGEPASATDFLDVVKSIRGKSGTQVTLTVMHKNGNAPVDIVVTRAKIKVDTVTLDWVGDDGKIALLEVTQFGTNTADEFRANLHAALAKSPRGIVLDLRFNTGGLLDAAVAMASTFLSDKVVVQQRDRDGTTSELHTFGRTLTALPLVVLQNGGSASASEIVAGALADHGRATVIGTQSFGKGTVQELIPLRDGAQLRLTVAKWLTPSGISISEKGITPDIEVKRTREQYENDDDPQLRAALALLDGASAAEVTAEFGKQEQQDDEAAAE